MTEILTYPNKLLRRETEIFTAFGNIALDLTRQMQEAMYVAKGVGLAAPQIGLPYKVFVTDGSLPISFFNPVILCKPDEETATELEGCLSFPEIFVPITRPLKIKVMYQDFTGERHELEAEGLLARVILHENDHLNQKLIVDYVGVIRQAIIKKKLLRKEK